jgi:hypothetical protein
MKHTLITTVRSLLSVESAYLSSRSPIREGRSKSLTPEGLKPAGRCCAHADTRFTPGQVSLDRSFDGLLRALSGLCVISEFCTSHRPPQREVLRAGVAMPGNGRRYRPRKPHIDVHFGDFEVPGFGIGAEGVKPDFGVLIGGRNTGVDGDSGRRGACCGDIPGVAI